MPKKRIIVTARGQKLDMDALKASQPNVTKLVVNKNKDAKDAPVAKTVPVQKKTQRINATIPAPVPTATFVADAPIIVEGRTESPVTHSRKKPKE